MQCIDLIELVPDTACGLEDPIRLGSQSQERPKEQKGAVQVLVVVRNRDLLKLLQERRRFFLRILMSWTRMWSRTEGASTGFSTMNDLVTVFLHLLVCLLHSPPDNSLSLVSVTYSFWSHVTVVYITLPWFLWFFLNHKLCCSLIANYILHLAFLVQVP